MSRALGPSQKTLSICATYRAAMKAGESERDVVGYLSADHGVLRPAIWKALRTGGILPPYKSKGENGVGRPLGGGQPGYSERRRLARRANQAILDEVLTQRVDRDPCARCGTRADLGCAHRLSPVDAFAEHLSEHGDVARAAQTVGHDPDWGGRTFAEIRRGLGRQAC